MEEVDVEVVDRESEASAVELDESEPIVVDSDEQSSDQVSFPKIRRACAQRTRDYAGWWPQLWHRVMIEDEGRDDEGPRLDVLDPESH